jgi:hypothetical protein
MKLFKRLLLLITLLIAGYAAWYAWLAFPIITGYGAKNLCSCVMLAGREPESVTQNELGQFPLSLGSFTVSYEDSSATATIFGLAKRKAVYRKGLGCALSAKMARRQELRQQKITLARKPAVDQDTLPWPAGNLTNDTVPPAINRVKLDAVVASAFEEPGPKPLRRTRAILVVYDGHLVAEKYAEGFDWNSLQLGWSMSKSLTNALVGILVKQGRLNLDDPAPIEGWQNDERHNITLNDLMHMSSGLEWEENYGGPSGATNMLFKKKDMGLYAAKSPLEFKPGEVFEYSSGTSNIISRIIRDEVGDDGYYAFPYQELFYKIGMYSMVMEPDAGGTFVGSSYSFATARDWARFGILFLDDGIWNNERILPEGWVAYSTKPAGGARRGEYGAQFWLNAGGKENPSNRFYPDVPADLYWADGFEGQNVFILPSKRLVVVKLSQSQGYYLDDNQFLKGVIDCLP